MQNQQVQQPNISGLYYINNIQVADNDNTIDKLNTKEWKPLSNSPNSRVVQHYGYEYDYNTYNIKKKCEEIPEFLLKYKEFLTNKCNELNIINNNKNNNEETKDKNDDKNTNNKYEFNQCIVNNYEIGQGISKHIDVVSYGDIIGCYTIGGGSSMIFRNKNNTNEKYEIYTEPNSLYIMSGDARYNWTHEMPSRKSDIINGTKIPRNRRVSITFRNIP